MNSFSISVQISLSTALCRLDGSPDFEVWLFRCATHGQLPQSQYDLVSKLHRWWSGKIENLCWEDKCWLEPLSKVWTGGSSLLLWSWQDLNRFHRFWRLPFQRGLARFKPSLNLLYCEQRAFAFFQQWTWSAWSHRWRYTSKYHPYISKRDRLLLLMPVDC